MSNVHHSSKYHKWETPPEIFNKLDEEFGFTLDPCCIPETAKCNKYFTPEDDGLKQNWSGETVYVNPPYGREIKDWVKKSYNEGIKQNTIVVMLIPARTDTRYFHNFIWDRENHRPKNNVKVRFLKGRIKFLKEGEKMNNAPFPSMVVIFN